MYFALDFMPGSGLNEFQCGVKPPLKRKKRPRRGTGDVDFILGGAEVDEGQHPWHASLSTNYGDEVLERYEFCGGTLIAKRAVLTGEFTHKLALSQINLLCSRPLHI